MKLRHGMPEMVEVVISIVLCALTGAGVAATWITDDGRCLLFAFGCFALYAWITRNDPPNYTGWGDC